MAPRLSVIVPFQDVETYLDDCLQSIALQTFTDFEVIMVDDGSTDDSTRIAAGYCHRDPRFKLIRQEGQGPGHARNTGIQTCHPEAEFLAFVDGDDVIPDYTYSLLIKTLEGSGSDFVSGNVRMMNSTTMWQSPLHKAPMKANKRGTHITRHRELIYDRTVWNKVFRRSFWDYNQIAFPEGVLYEDSWVNMYAHFRAEKVDVVTDFVYYWRRRDGKAAPSITQRYTEMDNLRDRFAAVDSVSTFLGQHRSKAYTDYKRWYDEICLKSDLLIHLKVLPDADQEYRDAFMYWANDFLDQVDPVIIDGLPAADRVKWALVREGRLEELLETLEFERKGGPMPVRRRLRRYADLPHLGNRSTGVDKDAYRMDKEFAVSSRLSSASWEDGRLHLTGTAYIRLLNVHKRHMSRKAIALRKQKTRQFTVIPAKTTYAPNATEHSNQSRYCYDWAGFDTVVNPERLKEKGNWVEGTWDVAAGVFSRGLFRYKGIATGDSGSGSHPPALYVDNNTRVLPLFRNGVLKIRVEVVRCRIVRHEVSDTHVLLYGVLLHSEVPEHGTFRLRSLTGAAQFDAPVWFTYGGEGWCHFTTRIPFDKLVPPGRRETAGQKPKAWAMDTNGWKTTLVLRGRKRPLYPVMAEDVEDGRHLTPAHLQSRFGDRELVIHRNGSGYVVLFERAALPTAHSFRWREDGTLGIWGTYHAAGRLDPRERAGTTVVMRSRAGGVEKVFPVNWEGDGFHFTCSPSQVPSLAGRIPLASGRWDFFLRVPGGDREDLMLKTERELIEDLPADIETGGRRYELQSQSYDRLTLLVHSAMPDHARGPYRQKELRGSLYPAQRRGALRETVLFDSFKGTQFSDSPRAVLEELVRRGGCGLAPQWVVRDDQVTVPPGVEPVRMWSPEWYEALARSRYIVANNHLPDWFERREGQIVVQTWHGTPLKKIGHDIEAVHFADKRYLERLEKEVRQWSMLVSPNSFSSPILRRAFGFEGELVETGYPRNDILRRRNNSARARQVREWIGIPPGKRVVLYAPTWRDDQYHSAGRYKFDFRIDLQRFREVLGHDHVLLVRRHPNVVDPVPEAGDGFVWDVSEYPDMAELSLITDVLVTDYSSLMFDFANTGRPMLFFTYDLEHYRDTLRGFYFDFERSAPGPLVRTSEDLLAGIRHIDQVAAHYANAYRWFQQQFCDLDDGRAAPRLLDRMLAAGGQEAASGTNLAVPRSTTAYRAAV
ncbi:CDP-glycerol glycerophosphotransferase family protein [Streptomyces polyrhachis]|uniref:CDP-glycerol glycerophosphotransferase family protein n=1 Tax=Streptomyces polyrhachis TaxID=1282885 RepID=A0ABW2GFG8_9ACTN